VHKCSLPILPPPCVVPSLYTLPPIPQPTLQVPDVFQIIVKEKGVFTNVTSPSTKAKLRLLFEVAPLALLVEKAGGASSCDGKCVSGLDVEVLQHDQRTQICYGSVGEVRRGACSVAGEMPGQGGAGVTPRSYASCHASGCVGAARLVAPLSRARGAAAKPPCCGLSSLQLFRCLLFACSTLLVSSPSRRSAGLRSTCTAPPPASLRSPPELAGALHQHISPAVFGLRQRAAQLHQPAWHGMALLCPPSLGPFL
jgi:hypothetical protein